MPELEADTNTPSNNTEPAYTVAGIAAAIVGFVVLVVTRLNRSFDVLDTVEMSDLKTWLALASPIVGAWFIRRRVTPNKRVEEKVQFSVAVGYAQAIEDHPPAVAPPAAPVAKADSPPAKAAPAKKAAKKR